MNEERLKKRYEREKKARLETEQILEEKSRELFARNEELRKLSEGLEKLVEERTRDLIVARDEALSAAKAKSQFMANMSHEIRTPLNGVLGIMKMLTEADLDPKSANLLETAKHSGKLLLEIVNDILDFSKLDAGQLEIHEESINLKHLINETVKPLAISAKNNQVSITQLIPDDFPTHISGDGLRLKQIINNLLSNAIKFTKEGTVSLTVEQIDRQYKLSVADDGIGMSDSQVKRIFNAFGQADGSITREYGGTGLGLTITQSLIHMMGGSIQVKSQAGVGSEFIITLPLVTLEDDEVCPKVAQINKHSRFKSAHVLLVEDNEVNQVVASHLLESAKLTFTIANNGQIALELCQNNYYDVILMDIQMPVMDGLQAAKHIRTLSTKMKDVPIIAMTAHATEQHRRDSFEAGMNEHITKPIDPTILYQTLGRYLEPLPPETLSDSDTNSSPMVSSVTTSKLDKLNVDEALHRLGGNVTLYLRLITSFMEKHRQLIPELKQFLVDTSSGEAQSLLHTIKGSAANIGANDLSKQAAHFEAELKDGRSEDFDNLTQRLELCWEATQEDMENVISKAETKSEFKPELRNKEVLLKLKVLNKLLNDDISQAEEIITELKNSQIDDRYSSIIQSLFEDIEVFNITNAQENLDAYLEAQKDE